MKLRILILLLSLSSLVQGQGKIDVLHYKFNLELNDKNDTIYGNAEITVVFLEQALAIEFDLYQKTRAKEWRSLKYRTEKSILPPI